MAKEASENDSKSGQCHGECFRCFYTGQAFYNFPEKENPTKAKQILDFAYVPRLNICAEFNAPKGSPVWLLKLARAMKGNVAHLPVIDQKRWRKI